MKELMYSELSDIGELITTARKERNMSMTDLSEATGISLSAISRYESGDRRPSVEILNRLLHALGKELVIRRAN